jgi:hypothetical protein
MVGTDSSSARISGVTVSYTPYNRPPSIEGIRLEGESAAVRGSATFLWSWADPDRDPVRVTLQYRPQEGGSWMEAASTLLDPESSGKEGSGTLSWDTAGVPEGDYRLRILGSDQPGNHPGEGRTVRIENGLTLRIDRTPPEMTVEPAGEDGTTIRVRDSLSRVLRLEVLREGETAFLALPVDGVCDSPRETFRIPPGAIEGEGPWTVRAVDEAGNTSQQPLESG